eukprot:CAMPEP_0197578686 /NCGR_PEP_ID=MMETSP1326-20131121/2794_1 /TAXON_ID=1155430 /ORGANISM="Genus nov. species nov., Strain RCC2288" /LENGTH=162 /DNA_ID=CAMNT_0043141895 /DNA_START=70 /DNA_END=556 /DNA_ORIENTATION=+
MPSHAHRRHRHWYNVRATLGSRKTSFKADLEGVAEEAVEHPDLEAVERQWYELALFDPLEQPPLFLGVVQDAGQQLAKGDDGEHDSGVLRRLGVREERAHGEPDEEADERHGNHAEVTGHLCAHVPRDGADDRPQSGVLPHRRVLIPTTAATTAASAARRDA